MTELSGGALRAGTSIGKFRVESVLGASAFATNYVVRDDAIGTSYVASEHFPRDYMTRLPDGRLVPGDGIDTSHLGAWLERFRRQARFWARMQHPAIAGVRAIVDAYGTAYLIVRQETAVPLARWLETLVRRPTQAELDHLLSPILDALESLHAHGIAYGDLSPERIVVRPEGSALLLLPPLQDRGDDIETFRPTGSESGHHPPETFAGPHVPIGPSSDIYALAAIVHETLAGQPLASAARRMIEDDVVPLSERGLGGYRPEFLAAVDWALRLRLPERPASVAAWRRQLLGGVRPAASAAAPPPSDSEPTAKSGQRTPLPAAMAPPPRQAAARTGAYAVDEVPFTLGSAPAPARDAAHAPRPPAVPPRHAPRPGAVPRASPAPMPPEPPPPIPSSRRGWGGIPLPDVQPPSRRGRPARERQAPEAADRALPVDEMVAQTRQAAGARKRRRPDDVSCSVFATETVRPRASCLVQVFLHVPEDAGRAATLAGEADPEAGRQVTRALSLPIERGATVDVELDAAGLQVSERTPARQSMTWQGQPASVEFLVAAPFTLLPKRLFPAVRVSVNGQPLGRVVFAVRVSYFGRSGARAITGEARRYRRAFLSYSSEDRPEVLKRAQALRLARIDVFQDVLSLEPGERWAQSLWKEIDKSDVFYLFWSSAAHRSEWVLKEAKYALQKQRATSGLAPDIVPVILETAAPLPPKWLRHLHFNDPVAPALFAAAQSPQHRDG